jgi:integrase/recombinase XerD
MISPELPDERETTAVADRGRRRSKQLDAGPFAADVASFRLHLAAENKAAGTIRIYTEAPLWFAAAHLLRHTDKTRWEQVHTQDIQRWITWLLGRYSGAYARQQYRSLRQFFGWLAAEDEVPDPMAGLRAPAVRDTPVPVFTSVELSRLEKACRGGTFAQRRDAAILAVFRATGIRLAELAGIRYHPGDPARSDLDLDRREIRVRGKGGKDRTVMVDHEAARRLDRYLRVRAKHEQAYRRGLWLGTGGRGPLTGNGIYQMVKRRGEQAGVAVSPHPVPAPLQPHLAGPRRRRGRPDGAERLVLPADAAPVRRQRARRPGTPTLRPDHERLTRPRMSLGSGRVVDDRP